MNNQKVVAVLLQECKRALERLSSETSDASEGDEREHQQCEALFPDDLRTLIKEAKEMKWPFVPERWQYKQAVGLEDKTNLQDMISARLHELLLYLKTSILVKDCATAAAIVFLIDRFLYWADASSKLLQIAKGLHKLQPETPIAPQLVIRQARISVNSGKLLKAEYILSSLIKDNGTTGVWKYAKESDRILVQSVCIQIRGQILQKLGMWYEAAELIWASIVGYFQLPQPDKKGIGTSLGILADIFASMSKEDYDRFKNNSQVDLSLLKEFDHHFLSAAEACKLAAVFGQFTPLFVLTAVNIRGTCLLSYSHSNECPPEKRNFYLSEAKESFEIGLLTKKDNEPVTSKQELHSFIKAAFCLTTVLCQASQLCKEAMQKLYVYDHSPLIVEEDKGALAKEIMSLIMSTKEHLQVQSFSSSDAKSYAPDNYKGDVEKPIIHGNVNFEKILEMHSQHHTAVCGGFESTCRSHKTSQGEDKMGACITALKTETRNVDTMCTTEKRPRGGRDTPKTSASQKARKSCERFSGQRQKQLTRSSPINVSLDEETESEFLDKGKNDEGSTSSRLSKSDSFASWEELDCDADHELLSEGHQRLKDSMDEQFGNYTTLSKDVKKNDQENNLHSLSSKTHQLSLHETQSNSLSKHSLQNNSPLANDIPTASSNSLLEETQHENSDSKQSEGKAVNMDSRNNVVSFCNSVVPPFSGPFRSDRKMMSSVETDSLEIVEPSALTNSRTKDRNRDSRLIHDHGQLSIQEGDAESRKSISEPLSRDGYMWVDPEGETVDNTEDISIEPHIPRDKMASASISNKPEMACDYFIRDWISKSAATNQSFEMPDVDPQAGTVDDWELAFSIRESSVDNFTGMSVPRPQPSHRPEATALPQGRKTSAASHFDGCATTEKDEGEKLGDILNYSHSSSSSLKSWYTSPHFSSSFSELESPSFLNSSGTSFVFVPGRTKESILQDRILNDKDYDKFLSGVEHNWLVQRLKTTGTFKPSQLHKTYSALLLKYSKKSGLWTAQETAVYLGDYLSVAKEGKQRKAFWIHFLHQEETLGRYVGKEYKQEKGLLHHFIDVERQITAQHYVTEFNKRLYEQKIPTQIFYIPSAVILLFEGKALQGCLSVEPYILGEFVKLSNNTKVVKTEYKATDYGLAYGHFSYEFFKGTDVVVDLQGWVTDNGKGLIYLTDPQIHSLTGNDLSSSTNFGKKGIYYFFNNQHVECNEICRCLSLTRPSVAKPS
uniref:Alpha kinase 1 n=1 Tax=Sphenodon punctatus TaxID=8508 RepID=A0A8D0HQM5_SPHPU